MDQRMVDKQLVELRANDDKARRVAEAVLAVLGFKLAEERRRHPLLAEVDRLRTERDAATAKLEQVLATKVPEIEAALDRFRERIGVVPPMPGKPPTSDPADRWIAYRGSATDFVTDMKAVIPPHELAFLKGCLGAVQPMPSERPPSRPFVATERQRERSEAYATFEKMGQLECDVIEWLSDNYEALKRRAVEASKARQAPLTEAEAGAWAGPLIGADGGSIAAALLAAWRHEAPPEVRQALEHKPSITLTSVHGGHVVACSLDEYHRAATVKCAACGDVVKNRYGSTSIRICPKAGEARPARFVGPLQIKTAEGRAAAGNHPEIPDSSSAQPAIVLGHLDGKPVHARVGDMPAWVQQAAAAADAPPPSGGQTLPPRRHEVDTPDPFCPQQRGGPRSATSPDIMWRPKVGDRVRTVETLTACATYRDVWREKRRAGVLGKVFSRTVVGPLGVGVSWFDVRHDDGTEAPYDEDELRPA